MVKAREVLGIIPARGGSKGVPRKNLHLLAGQPLLAYSVASGLASRLITRLIISTDDEEIAAVATSYGAEAPFLRPAAFAQDDTPDFPVLDHALEWLAERDGYRPELVVQLRPTTPFRPCGLIDDAVRVIIDDPLADCVRGVTSPKQTPFKMWRPGPDGYLTPLVETGLHEPYNMPRQKLPPAFWQRGHIDVIRTSTILQQRSLTGQRVRPIMVDQDYCVDIDTPADFEAAERTLQQKRLNIDLPGAGSAKAPGALPERIELVVFDFDGVFTDNRVLVFDDGREAVLCNRGDGMGLELLRAQGVPTVVLSTEKNPIVAARCGKLRMEFQQGLANKVEVLRNLAVEKDVDLSAVVYVGNDVNDLECMQAVGFAIVPSDAHAAVRPHADLVLSSPGGFGAVREVCDLILAHLAKTRTHAPAH